MRIMIDTNVLISAVLFPNPRMTKLLDKVALEHTLVLASFIMEELQRLFDTKFSGKKTLLDRFLSNCTSLRIRSSNSSMNDTIARNTSVIVHF
jgi:predicted nucleic acid-binding protein